MEVFIVVHTYSFLVFWHASSLSDVRAIRLCCDSGESLQVSLVLPVLYCLCQNQAILGVFSCGCYPTSWHQIDDHWMSILPCEMYN